MRRRFTVLEPIRIAIETGTHSPWVSRLLEDAGHEVLVANARKLGFILRGSVAETGEFVDDMIGAGIVDPAKVTRTALQNAASIGSLLLTTEAVIADRPEKEEPMPAGAGGGMGGMDF